MNLVLFTPVAKLSAIGRMAALVTRALVQQGHSVKVVRTEADQFLLHDSHDFGVPLLPWTDVAAVRKVAAKADALVYHIGDNYGFHEGGVHWLPELPGLVCLHDFFLGHLFYGWSQLRRTHAQSVLRKWYGEEVASHFFEYRSNESFINGTRHQAPMIEWICALADAVITHSSWGCDRVLASCGGPVQVLPLAYDAPAAGSPDNQETASGQSTLQILTIGHVNFNKRVDRVIQAIGNNTRLKECFVYRLVGLCPPETADALTALAQKLGVKLVISGEVSEAELSAAIEQSDIISCLRRPSLEAASASAIEALLYGKPVIVIDTGFYSEIPDDCVMKISSANEVADLEAVLGQLIDDVSLRHSIGERAKAWACEMFSPENYARGLVVVAQAMISVQPVRAAANHFCELLGRWSVNSELLDLDELARPLTIFQNTPKGLLPSL